jgi:hypothetical protein
MFTILPCDAIIAEMNGFESRLYQPSDWWMTYEHFCRKVLELKNHPYQCLNNTSSVNNWNFFPMYDIDQPRKHLAHLFKYIIGGYSPELLKYVGIKKWGDLSKPIAIHGWRPKIFPRCNWFLMDGRQFKGSPNSCHPEAKWVYCFYLVFCSYLKRWRAVIAYGYKHDSSSWNRILDQDYRETLDDFAIRIDKWIDELLVPEKSDWVMEADRRCDEERAWHRKRKAVNDVFWFDYFSSDIYDDEQNALIDRIMSDSPAGISGRKIIIDSSRYRTLMRWAEKKPKDGTCSKS